MELKISSRLKDYTVLFEDDVLEALSRVVERSEEKQFFFVTDDNVYALYQDLFARFEKAYQATVHIVPSGGNSKSLEQVSLMYEKLLDLNFTKKDYLITVGGGVIGDLGGFVAATFNRGIQYIQIPTTLLSQVDSSIGGKVGVHFKEFTNIIGAIYPPNAVIISTLFLASLPKREFSCGMSEIIKIAFIHDQVLFEKLTVFANQHDSKLLKEIIYQAVNNKKKIVERDEWDEYDRLSLNFGHTIGHAIETLTNHDAYLHGEAIAIGMMFEAKVARQEAKLSTYHFERLEQMLVTYGLPIEVDATLLKASSLFEVLKTDKKNSAQEIAFILPLDSGFTLYRIDKEDYSFITQMQELLALP